MTSNPKRGPIGALRRRPSPAMAVAILALVFAMVGTAAATQALHQDGAQASKKKKSKPVPGPAGAPGANGANGTNGADGTARAYGQVNSAGTIVTRSKNVTGVSGDGSGHYCITLAGSIDASTTGAVVTPNFANDSTGSGSTTHAEWDSAGGGCSAGQLEVRTWAVTTNGSHNYSVAEASEGFFFVVP